MAVVIPLSLMSDPIALPRLSDDHGDKVTLRHVNDAFVGREDIGDLYEAIRRGIPIDLIIDIVAQILTAAVQAAFSGEHHTAVDTLTALHDVDTIAWLRQLVELLVLRIGVVPFV